MNYPLMMLPCECRVNLSNMPLDSDNICIFMALIVDVELFGCDLTLFFPQSSIVSDYGSVCVYVCMRNIWCMVGGDSFMCLCADGVTASPRNAPLKHPKYITTITSEKQ